MAVCSKCGAEAAPGAKFCKACGSGLGRSDAALEQKKARVLAGEKKRSKIPVIVAATAASVLLAAWLLSGNALTKPGAGTAGMQAAKSQGASRASYKAVSAEGGAIRIPESDLSGSTAAFYVYPNGGKPVKFFLLRAADGTVRAALDACTSCYHAKLGYRQQGENMICNNCGMAFRSVDVGVVTGGCNPIPLEKSSEAGAFVVKVQDLEAGAKYF